MAEARHPTVIASRKYGGVCECGDHAWARLTRGYVTMVQPEDAWLLQQTSWHALARLDKGAMVVYAVATRNSKKT